LKKFVKIRQALEVPPPDPSWPPAAGDSAPRSLPSRDHTHTYFTSIKRFKFVAFLMKLLRSKF